MNARRNLLKILESLPLEGGSDTAVFQKRSNIPYLKPLGPDVFWNLEFSGLQKGNMVLICYMNPTAVSWQAS